MHKSTENEIEKQLHKERHQMFIRSIVTTPGDLDKLLGGKEIAGWFFNVFHGRELLKTPDDKAAYQIAYELVSDKAYEMMQPIPKQPDYSKRKEDLIDIALCIGAIAAVAVAIKLGFFGNSNGETT